MAKIKDTIASSRSSRGIHLVDLVAGIGSLFVYLKVQA